MLCIVKDLFCLVFQMCAKHLSNSQDAEHHYRAVCRALLAEALELVTFLDKVSAGQKVCFTYIFSFFFVFSNKIHNEENLS